jgi:hypothetical protein
LDKIPEFCFELAELDFELDLTNEEGVSFNSDIDLDFDFELEA